MQRRHTEIFTLKGNKPEKDSHLMHKMYTNGNFLAALINSLTAPHLHTHLLLHTSTVSGAARIHS